MGLNPTQGNPLNPNWIVKNISLKCASVRLQPFALPTIHIYSLCPTNLLINQYTHAIETTSCKVTDVAQVVRASVTRLDEDIGMENMTVFQTTPRATQIGLWKNKIARTSLNCSFFCCFSPVFVGFWLVQHPLPWPTCTAVSAPVAYPVAPVTLFRLPGLTTY